MLKVICCIYLLTSNFSIHANGVDIMGLVAQTVASTIADPVAVSSIPAGTHTFAQIACEIISKVIFLFPPIQKGLLSVTS